MYLLTQTAIDAGDIGTQRTMVIMLFWLGEKPEDPQFGFEPHAGRKIARFWYLPSIYNYIPRALVASKAPEGAMT